MQDELQTEEQPIASTPEQTTTLMENGADETPAAEPTPTRAPAATASSYRDIIAERLARKSGGNDASTHSPMAHSSDIEFTQRPAPTQEEFGNPSLSPEIKLRTAQQEMSFGATSEAPADDAERPTSEAQSDAGSSRDRARIRQQERAALRRQPRTAEPLSMQTEDPIEEEEPSFDEEPMESALESSS